MENKSYVIDKSEWERGPWDEEPDRLEFTDPDTGLPCLIVRGPVGPLCGYVGVPAGHPWYGKDYDSIEPYPDVHGGLTYSGKCHYPICHEADEEVWWVGFDCGHLGDYTDMKIYAYMPEELRSRRHKQDVYRNIEYVKNEVARLAKQVKKAA